jgi:SAM-dependent methyltransferase
MNRGEQAMNGGSHGARTIRDFGEQWTHYTENEGYYASPELFGDLVRPLLAPEDFRGKRVAELGSGTGRIVRMMLEAGAAHVIAVEPSEAMAALERNTRADASRITYLPATADQLPPSGDLDLVVSIGVLHHIPDPAPAARAAWLALKPGGRFLVWLYGREGNGLYLTIAEPARWLTRRLPHPLLAALSHALALPLDAYVALCRRFSLPMRDYMLEHVSRLSPAVRRLTIYDQLNPAWAKYYTETEARALLEDAGFVDVQLHHRHGYSWTVVGTKRD